MDVLKGRCNTKIDNRWQVDQMFYEVPYPAWKLEFLPNFKSAALLLIVALTVRMAQAEAAAVKSRLFYLWLTLSCHSGLAAL